MGVEIYGWIEIREYLDNEWVGMVKIDSPQILDDRNRLMEVFLFAAHRKYVNGLAPQRGIPKDASQEFKDLQDELQGHSHSWIEWIELKDIIWSEDASGKQQIIRKTLEPEPDDKVELSAGWELIFNLMKLLAEYHGVNNVRLVVGFL